MTQPEHRRAGEFDPIARENEVDYLNLNLRALPTDGGNGRIGASPAQTWT